MEFVYFCIFPPLDSAACATVLATFEMLFLLVHIESCACVIYVLYLRFILFSQFSPGHILLFFTPSLRQGVLLFVVKTSSSSHNKQPPLHKT